MNGSAKYVRDLILPIIEYEVADNGDVAYKRLLGTGFLVGASRKLITAAHVFEGVENVAALRIDDAGWLAVGAKLVDVHPTEDIGVFDVNGHFSESSLVLLRRPIHASTTYHLWGYPEDILTDRLQVGPAGRPMECPDLIFSCGHVRRRFSGSVPGIRGSKLLEISEIAGAGFSGAPLITSVGQVWQVTGVYLGERLIESGGRSYGFGYCLRIEDVFDWLVEKGVDVVSQL